MTLKRNIIKMQKMFGLDHILMNSFVLQVDEKTQLSAADMVYALTSLLECPH